MIIRGHRVGFYLAGGPGIAAYRAALRRGEEPMRLPIPELAVPPEFVLAEDAAGEYGRRCDVLLLAPQGVLSARSVSPADKAKARGFLGPHAKLRAVALDVPGEDWAFSHRVAALLYTLSGTARVHAFRVPQSLYEHRSENAWKLRLTDRCLLDDHGFERP